MFVQFGCSFFLFSGCYVALFHKGVFPISDVPSRTRLIIQFFSFPANSCMFLWLIVSFSIGMSAPVHRFPDPVLEFLNDMTEPNSTEITTPKSVCQNIF